MVFGVAIVGKRNDRDAPAGIEIALHLNVFGIHQIHEVFHDDIHTIFMKITAVAKTKEIEFEALAFHHFDAWNVVDNDVSEIRLPGFWAQGGKFGAIQSHEILIFGMLINERLEHIGCVIECILGALIAEKGNPLQFFFAS